MADSPNSRLSTRAVPAIGATLCEVWRGEERIGHVRRRPGRKTWEWRPEGWDGWSGDARLMRDAIAEVNLAADMEWEGGPVA